MKYFVLTVSEDGDVYLVTTTREDILREVKDGEITVKDIKTTSPDGDLMAEAGTYIFKGELVCPTPKKVVEEYDIV